MKLYKYITVVIIILLMLTSCNKESSDPNKTNTLVSSGLTTEKSSEPSQTQQQISEQTIVSETGKSQETIVDTDQAQTNNDVTLHTEESSAGIDYNLVKPNESGKIMVVMFHNFIKEYVSGDKEYTTTLDAFRTLLLKLYDMNYRLISLSDYVENNIEVQAGCIPIVFTFDDATAGQFSLIEENGELTLNPYTAVAVMEEFSTNHPDFGLEGSFFIFLNTDIFKGKGTKQQRLQYLVDMGLEIGNHTYTHFNLKNAKSIEEIQREIGLNQKKLFELIPGYIMKHLSLPYGAKNNSFMEYIAKGVFEGTEYRNDAMLEVGWDPAPSPVHIDFEPLSLHRVRASGLIPVDADLEWWLGRLSASEQYISDGNPDTVTVPENKLKYIDVEKLSGKKLVSYTLK